MKYGLSKTIHFLCDETTKQYSKQTENIFEFFQEKTGDQKNASYSRDFKTLADVLIQETVRHDLGKHYPELRDHIYVGAQ